MTRWEEESNESMYERCGVEPCANGVKCDVVEWVKKKIESPSRRLPKSTHVTVTWREGRVKSL